MEIRTLQSPDDYQPTPSVRYNVLSVEPASGDWLVHTHRITWDEDGNAVDQSREQTMETRRLNLLKQVWQAEGFIVVAHYFTEAVEVLFYENREDRRALEAQTSITLPDSLEVWICPNRQQVFKCEIPKTVAFSVRSADQLAQADIGHTELEVTERRGMITAKVYWLNGQPSAEAEARWQPIIERKVREYLQASLSQSTNVFVKGILEDSVRQGDDARDLIVAQVDLAARLAALKAMDYQPMAE